MISCRICFIAVRVESLRQAERFYSRLFDLKALSRRNANPDGRAGVSSLLGRGDFRLGLVDDVTEPAGNGRLAHICLDVCAADIESLADRAITLGCRILRQESGHIDLEDVYGVRWRILANGMGGADERCAADS